MFVILPAATSHISRFVIMQLILATVLAKISHIVLFVKAHISHTICCRITYLMFVTVPVSTSYISRFVIMQLILVTVLANISHIFRLVTT